MQSLKVIVLLTTATVLFATAAAAQGSRCESVGGMLMTNLGAVDNSTSMGPVTGDLAGAVGATIGPPNATGDELSFSVQHHWVTTSGDTLSIDPTTAEFKHVVDNIFAVKRYTAHVSGGTGKYQKARGDLEFIGEVDLSSLHLVLRYTGSVCLAADH